MTVKELKITNEVDTIKINKVLDCVEIAINGQKTYLARTEAHLLKLWLEEHLK